MQAELSSEIDVFRNREDAAQQLAATLKHEDLHQPLVLAIPRGGAIIGSVLARALGADLDAVLARKLRAPRHLSRKLRDLRLWELPLGAIAEGGRVYLNHHARGVLPKLQDYLVLEGNHQLTEIAWRHRQIHADRQPAPIEGRSVIVTDDGIATGSTMIAALQTIRAQNPRELIVAVPVASEGGLAEVSNWCDQVICLLRPQVVRTMAPFYEELTQITDLEVVSLLRSHAVGRELTPVL